MSNTTFPYTPKHVLHKHGGKITEITSIGHKIDRPQDGYSRDYWFFNGKVQWDDGKTSEGSIDPGVLCYENDEGHKEICMLSDHMAFYLNLHGVWRDVAPRGWSATKRK